MAKRRYTRRKTDVAQFSDRSIIIILALLLTILVLGFLNRHSIFPPEPNVNVQYVRPTARPSATPSTGTYYTIAFANLYTCPRLTCELVTSLSFNEQVNVIDTSRGDLFNTSTLWYTIQHDNEEVYVHSSMVARTPLEFNADAENERPSSCAEARRMGLSARAAGRYSHLDRDGDGVACYGD